MFINKIIILLSINFVSNFNVCESLIYGYDDEDFNFDDKCVTKNNEIPGYCTEFLKCNYANKLYRSKRSSEITLCRMIGRIPFVCCPLNLKPFYPFKTEQKKTFKKISSKFQKALCGNAQPIDRLETHIINGDRAKIAEFPFQVALGYNWKNVKDREFNCGGSLIADDVVLTAAHCVNKKGAQPVIVRIGRVSMMNFINNIILKLL